MHAILPPVIGGEDPVADPVLIRDARLASDRRHQRRPLGADDTRGQDRSVTGRRLAGTRPGQ
jgi:hypothetical protein